MDKKKNTQRERVGQNRNSFYFIIFHMLLLVTHEIFGRWNNTLYRANFISVFTVLTRSLLIIWESSLQITLKLFPQGFTRVHMDKEFLPNYYCIDLTLYFLPACFLATRSFSIKYLLESTLCTGQGTMK